MRLAHARYSAAALVAAAALTVPVATALAAPQTARRVAAAPTATTVYHLGVKNKILITHKVAVRITSNGPHAASINNRRTAKAMVVRALENPTGRRFTYGPWVCRQSSRILRPGDRIVHVTCSTTSAERPTVGSAAFSMHLSV